MDKKRKASVRRYVILTILVLLVIGLAVLPSLSGSGEEENKASILSAEAKAGSVSRSLLGGGPLEGGEAVEVKIPEGVKLRELLVSGGDYVRKGDKIAAVDKVSVMTAVTEIQDSMQSILKDMQQLSWKITPGAVTVSEDNKLLVDGREIPEERLGDYAKYFQLAAQHREYETLLAELFPIYQAGAIVAPADGMVSELDKNMIEKLAANGGEYELIPLALHTPNDDGTTTADDGLEHYGTVGKITEIDGESWKLELNPIPKLIEDFANPSVSLDGLISLPAPYPASAVMVYSHDEETDTWSWTAGTAEVGDILLFVDAWVIKIGHEDPAAPDGGETPTPPGGNGSFPGLPGGAGASLEGLLGGASASLDLSALMGAAGGLNFGGFGGFNQQQGETLYPTEGKTLCKLIPLETMSLSIALDEQDIALVSPGMNASLTLDALPGETFSAVITGVSKFGTNNGGSSKFAVTLELPYAEGMLPGMNAAVTIPMEELSDVLTLPVEALTEIGSRTVVYTGYDVKKETLLNPVPVTTGLSDGMTAQILSGIEEGTTVWYSYYDKVEISNAVEPRTPFG